MATKMIQQYTAALTIDGTNDLLLEYQNSSGVYKSINRTTFLGVSGQPADISTAQALTNKTIGNTNTVTLKDTLFTLQDDSDATKQLQFQLSGITTGNTRTITVPDASFTMVGTTTTQTLTNKTLTSPTITGGTIDNSTITVDSISGHTTSTIVSVGGVQFNNGVVSTANSITATSIAAGAIQPQALTAGTGTGWAMQTWTPVFVNFTKGNAVITSVYVQIGKSVFYHLDIVLGTTSVMGTAPTFTLPVTATNRTTNFPLGLTSILDASAGSFNAITSWATSTTGKVIYWDANNVGQNITSSAPMVWTTNDTISINGSFEAA